MARGASISCAVPAGRIRAAGAGRGFRRLFASCSLVAVTLAPLVSSAQDAAVRDSHADEEVWERHFAVMGIVGFGTPVGQAGVEVEFSPAPFLALSLGAGFGSGTENTDCLPPGHIGVCRGPLRDRVQTAAMGRLRVLRGRDSALALGAGASTGGYSWNEFTMDAPARKTADRAFWLNLEIGGEYRSPSGFSARGFAGYGRMLNPAALKCLDTGVSSGHCEADHQGDGEGVVYFGGGAGWAF